MVTNKDINDLHCIIFKELFSLNNIDFDIMESIPDGLEKWDFVILDQYIQEIITTKLIAKLITPKSTNIYMLSSRIFTPLEEQILTTAKVSILSMPVNENEIYNRIINAI